MNKDEILMKSRQEYQKEDEREIYITTQGFMYGAVGMAIVFFILVFLKLFLDVYKRQALGRLGCLARYTLSQASICVYAVWRISSICFTIASFCKISSLSKDAKEASKEAIFASLSLNPCLLYTSRCV